MVRNIVVKDPSARLPYSIDWSGWVPPGDQIVSAVWTAHGGLMVHGASVNGTETTVVLSGGVVGALERVTCHVTTQQGYEDSRSLEFLIVEM